MNLDLRMELLSSLVIFATLAFFTLEFYRKTRKTVPSTRYLFAAFLSLTVSAAALLLRGVIPTPLSNLISNPAIFGGYTFYLLAGAELTGHRVPWKVFALATVLFFLVFFYFIFIVPSLPIRSLLINGAIVVLSAVSVYHLGHPRDADLAGVFRNVSTVFALLILLHLFRLVFILTVVVRSDFRDAPSWDVLFFMVGTALPVALGLVVNELVVNALKHAFPEGRRGRVTVRYAAEGGIAAVTVEDDGVGFTETGIIKKVMGFGLDLTANLAKQLRGTLRREVPGGGGTRFVMEFPCFERDFNGQVWQTPGSKAAGSRARTPPEALAFVRK